MKLHTSRQQVSKKERLSFVLLLCSLFFLLLPSPLFVKVALIQHGFVAQHLSLADKSGQLLQDLALAPVRYLFSNSDMPWLKVDIKFQEWLKIINDREQSLSQGKIIADRSLVNGEVHFLGQSYQAKIRLNGDMLDHIIGAKHWSFRVELKKSQAILASRRFSLVSSNVRLHQGPMLFAETLKSAKFDIISPKTIPVKVQVNGDDWGVMLFEEAFSQDLLALNKRTQGLIVRLDLIEQQTDDDQKITRIFRPRVLQRNTLLKSPTLNKQRTMALSLLNDFLAGKRSASDVFDHEKLGQYLATVDVWSAWHALAWNNWRWYYNPHTAKFEPIQSDVLVSPSAHFWLTQAVSKQFNLVNKMLSDPKVNTSYQAGLQKLHSMLQSGRLQAHLAAQQDDFLAQLHHSVSLAGRYDFTIMAKQANCLILGYLEPPCALVPLLRDELHQQLELFAAQKSWDLVSYFSAKSYPNGNSVLVINNNSSDDLTIQAVTGKNKQHLTDELDLVNANLPMVLAANSQIRLSIPAEIIELDVFAGLGTKKIGKFHYLRDVLPLSFIPRPTSHTDISAYAFIKVTDSTWEIPQGNWLINDYLVTPDNWTVNIAAGAQLYFTADAGLMIFGKLEIYGTQAAPVLFTRQNLTKQKRTRKNVKYWSGVTVFGNKEKSVLNHVTFEYLRNPNLGFWQASGALNFVDAKLKINQVLIQENNSADAINLINSQINIENLIIKNTLADGLDCDFCWGSIRHSQFINIGQQSGGDGIDVSGAKLLIDNVSFDHIEDKAISVGENSRVVAQNINISSVNFALVAKDNSKVSASNVTLENIKHYAAMTYSKKAIFGGATMKINQMKCQGENCTVKVIAQAASQLLIDGIEQPSQSLNIKSLYNTVMKTEQE